MLSGKESICGLSHAKSVLWAATMPNGKSKGVNIGDNNSIEA